MDNPLLGMLNQWTIGAIALGPFVFQHIKRWILNFYPKGREMSKLTAVIGNAACIAGAIVVAGVKAGEGLMTIATQVAIGLIISEVVYKQAVEPMANSSNPIVPQTATAAEAKAERA